MSEIGEPLSQRAVVVEFAAWLKLVVPANQFPTLPEADGQTFRQSPARQNEVRAARVVEVAFVVVAFTPVKFWRVVEPVWSALPTVRRPLVILTVPVKLAEEEIVCPLMSPEV